MQFRVKFNETINEMLCKRKIVIEKKCVEKIATHFNTTFEEISDLMRITCLM